MDTTSIILIIVLAVLVLLSAFFSASETAFSSANRVRLMSLEADGSKRAGKMLKMLDNYDKVLTTILIGNNIVNILMSSLGTILFISLLQDANLAAIVSTAVITVVVLIFGEITPKSVAKEMPEQFGMKIQPILAFFMIILTPFNLIFSLWKKLVKKVFRLKNASIITETELITYVETAANEGGIEEHESQLIKSAIEFEDVDVQDIMVARVNVIAISQDAKQQEIEQKFCEHGFSRMPVYSETIDSIIGIIHQKDFYEQCMSRGSATKDILQNIVCVADNMKISVVLRMLQKAKVHMAVVVDEFGGTSGVVTLEDILEELVGEIYDEHDEEEVFVRRIDDNTFSVLGEESLSHLFETLDFSTKEEFDSTTVGGFVIEQIGKIPASGETVVYENLEFTVTKANNKRVLEVQIKVLEVEQED